MRVFKYVRVLNIPGLPIARVLNFQGYTVFTYFHKYDRVLNMSQDTTMERSEIFQDSEYARFLPMSASHKVLNMTD